MLVDDTNHCDHTHQLLRKLWQDGSVADFSLVKSNAGSGVFYQDQDLLSLSRLQLSNLAMSYFGVDEPHLYIHAGKFVLEFNIVS